MKSVSVDTVSRPAVVRALALSAIHDELVENGYRAMTLESVAARAGVDVEALRSVFVSKESILVAHLDRMADSLISLLSGIAHSSAPPRERLRDALLTRVTFRFDVLRPYRAHLDEMREPLLLAIRHRAPRQFEREERIIARILADCQRAGMADVVDPVPTARTLLTATNALLPAEGNLSIPPVDEISRTAARLIDIVLDGVLRPRWPIPAAESPRIDATAL